MVAWECLRQTFRPTPASVEAVIKTLGGGGKAALDYLERKLQPVETIGAARDRIRFALDPLAEYMGGLQMLQTYSSDADAWRRFLSEADAMPDAPEGIKGLLLAVRDRCISKGGEVRVPDFVAGELARRCTLADENARNTLPSTAATAQFA